MNYFDNLNNIDSLMKRKERADENKESKNIEYLQKKLEEEKMILVKENKRLQKQIYEEIEENNLNKIKYEKREQMIQANADMLLLQNEKLKSEILLLQSQISPENNHDMEMLEILKSNKEKMEENSQLKEKLEEYYACVMQLQSQKQELEKQNKIYKTRSRDEEKEIKMLTAEIKNNKQLYFELKQELDQTLKELQLQIKQREENARTINHLEGSNSHLKKKNKQFNQAMDNLEKKFAELHRSQLLNSQNEISALKTTIEKLEQEKMTLQTKIGFLEVNVAQKDEYNEKMKKQIDQLKESYGQTAARASRLEESLNKSENENRRMIIELENQKSKSIKELENMQKNLNEEIVKAKKKVADDMLAMLKNGEGGSHKNIETYMEGLRSYKSQINIRNGFEPAKEQKNQMPYEKFRYENQITSLSNQIQNMKKQIAVGIQQNNHLKSQMQEQKAESEEKDKKYRQLQLTLEKVEHLKNVEEQKLRLQIRNLRNKETECLETVKNYADLEEATNLKVGFYEKKVKQFSDNIDRKEQIIENLKNQRFEFQNRAKFMEDKLAAAIQQLENLKKFKSDTMRKDDLLKDYKQKIEKLKKETDALKLEIDKLKKDKSRLQRNLQSKEDYINTLKAKVAKDQEQRDSQTKDEKIMKEFKEKHEIKLKKLKKQCDDYGSIVQSLRLVVVQKIEESIERSSEKQTIKQQGSWEAAHVLGLKSSEIEEFINPTINLDRHICQDLDNLWEKGEYEEFMRSSLEYLILKNQHETLE